MTQLEALCLNYPCYLLRLPSVPLQSELKQSSTLHSPSLQRRLPHSDCSLSTSAGILVFRPTLHSPALPLDLHAHPPPDI